MTDDDLRDRLRRADPAAVLEPAAPDRVNRLVEEAMSRTHTRRWALPVAAALVLIGAGAAWAVTRPAEVQILDAHLTPAPSSAVTVSLKSSGMQAKCREPEAARLAESADFAFEGTVTGLDGGRVTLAVTRVFRGPAAGAAEVSQTGDTSEQMLGSGSFETGKDYLVASSEGTVLICGYSGEAGSPGLRELYETAF